MEEPEFEAQMKFLNQALQNINKQIDAIAERTANGAMLSYPKEYRNPELFDLQKQCTDNVDHILNRMQQLQTDFFKARKTNGQ